MRERLPPATTPAPPSVASVLSRPGSPLPAPLRAHAGRALGLDLSATRIHHDEAAGASARALSARAYAARPHLVFAPGMYQPDTTRGQSLLLHELGHFAQQRPIDPAAPIGVTTTRGHEHNADRLVRGATTTADPLPANHVACSLDSDDAPSLASLITDATGHAPTTARPAPPQVGLLKDGNTYIFLDADHVAVRFAPRSERAGGQRIIDDADDPASPPTATLKATGQKATQHEKKTLFAYDAHVTAVYKAKDLQFSESGAPVAISRYKPISVDADTTRRGRLVQSEHNTTKLFNEATPDAPAVVRESLKDKTIRASFNFSKLPTETATHTFDKFERAAAVGHVQEVSTTRVTDHTTGQVQEARSVQDVRGRSEAGRGKARAREGEANGDYVLANKASGRVTTDADKHTTQALPSGRTLTVGTTETKRGQYARNDKNLTNQGIEYQAVDQRERKDKQGAETTGKAVRSVLHRSVVVREKGPDGVHRDVVRRVPVARTTARSYSNTRGSTTPEVREDRKLDRAGESAATKVEDTTTKGTAATASIVTDSGSGLRAATVTASASSSVLGRGGTRSYKKGEGPDVAAASIGKLNAGQTDLYGDNKTWAGDKTRGNHVGGSLALSSTTATAGLDASGTLGSYSSTSTPKDAIQTSELLGIFSVDTVHSATHLAGAHIEAKAEAKAQRGGQGAQVKAGQISAGLSGTVQIGYGDERGVEYIVKPKLEKISNPSLRSLVALIEPVLDLKFKAHYLVGAELKAEASVARGGDAGKVNAVGASGFAGVRGGIDIDGSVQVGNPGGRLGSIKGGVAVIAGASAAWKTTSALTGGRVVVGGEGSFSAPIGGTGSIRAELDVWKLGNIGVALAKKGVQAAADVMRSDDVARQRVAAGEHTRLGLPARVALINDLLLGHTSAPEQAAIVAVLEHAASRFEFFTLVGQVGDTRLRLALDGVYNHRYHALRGDP